MLRLGPCRQRVVICMPLIDTRSGNRGQGIALSTCQNNAFLGQALHLLAQSVDMRFDSMRAQAVLETPDLGKQLFLCNAVGVCAIKIFQNGLFIYILFFSGQIIFEEVNLFVDSKEILFCLKIKIPITLRIR